MQITTRLRVTSLQYSFSQYRVFSSVFQRIKAKLKAQKSFYEPSSKRIEYEETPTYTNTSNGHGSRHAPIKPESRPEAEPVRRGIHSSGTLSARAEVEPTLSDEQYLVDTILAGRNVFYTGSAGCGKSLVLRTFVKKLKAQGKRTRICAPTNLAALNVDGITLW
jgi:hypothetical protein